MKAGTETDIVRACLDYLKLRGVVAWRNNTTGVYDPVRKKFRTFTGRKGVSDILGVIPPSGRALAIECKKPRQYPSPEQRQFLADITASGGVAGVARGIEDVAKLLEGNANG